MSKPREWWWPAAKAMIRAYPALHEELADIRRQSVVASASGMPRAGGTHRSTEDTVIRQLPEEQQHAHDAVEKAIEITKQLPEGKIRLQIISMVLWKRECTVADAAYRLHVGRATAWRYHGDFIRQVGRCYGYMES